MSALMIGARRWQPILAATAYCGCEAFALLSGLAVLPHVPLVAPLVGSISTIAGITIERWLAVVSGERLPIAGLPFALGLAYVIPPFAGFAGRWIAWLLWASAIMFAGLIARMLWRVSRH